MGTHKTKKKHYFISRSEPEVLPKVQPEGEPRAKPDPQSELNFPVVSPSSGAVPKRVSAVRSRARWASASRVQRQASVCLPFYEEESDLPQCSHWESPPRRLSVPARLVPRDISGEGWSEVPRPLRESTSTDAPGLLEQGLDRMARRLLLKSRSFDEEHTPPTVLYNDIGSKEAVGPAESLSPPGSDLSADSDRSEDADTVRMEYQELWKLRATFEEEETTDCIEDGSSDTQGQITVVEDDGTGGNDDDDDRLLQTGFSTSQDSETPDDPSRATSRMLNLSSEVRRQNYKVLLARRLQRKTESSADNSLDSMETDCSSTDASRTEGGVTTSSFDSTTDNTDGGGGDSQGHPSRLQQMKADSGYKSMESANGNKPAKLSRKHVPFQEAQVSGTSSKRSAQRKRRQLEGVHTQASSDDGGSTVAGTPGGSGSLPDLPESGYNDVHGKVSVFHRFFRPSRRSSRSSGTKKVLLRDYSIDSRTDALFREFSRQDPALDVQGGSTGPGTSPRLGSSKLLSPQLSIEEEGSDDSHSAMEDDWKPQEPCCDTPIARLPTD